MWGPPVNGQAERVQGPAVTTILGEPPVRAPARIVAGAEELAGCRVGVYVIDIDGSCLIRLAGDHELFPDTINAPVGVGPEIALERVPDLQRIAGSKLQGSVVVPLTVRDRAIGVLISEAAPEQDLSQLGAEAAVALEFANGYSDVVHMVRRRKQIQPAAETQQNLLPPRLARLQGVDLAGGVLPGYDVAGDFFDYADNPDGLWLCVADAMGKGNDAAALASLAVGALRAARRGGASLEQAARIAHGTMVTSVEQVRFLTAIIGQWDPSTRVFRWISAGHPPPLLLRRDGSAEELFGAVTYPLGLFEGERTFEPAERRLDPGDRLLLYSDGLTERERADGTRIGIEGLLPLLRERRGDSAARIVRALQDAVSDASPKPLRDDATLLLLAPHS